jgi:hypothetical protein
MKRSLIGTAALALVLALTGCSASGADSGAASGAAQQGAASEQAAGDSEAAADRQIVTVGTMSITADDPVAAAGEATRIVEQAGGRIDARSETAPGDGEPGGALLTLRVPSDILSDTIDELKALGESTSVSLQESDVTSQTQDLDARITASRASVDRLTALIASASDIKVLITLEDAVSERQAALESMEAERRSLADQVSLSTIDLQLVSPERAPIAAPDTFWGGLTVGWGGFTGFVGFLLVAAGVLLPWLVTAAVLALVTLVALRRRRQRVATDPATPVPNA